MTDQIRITPRGLVTDPSAYVAGDGGLKRAENVLCTRDGLLIPRSRITANSNINAVGFTSRYVREWEQNYWYAAEDGSETNIFRNDSTSYITIPGRNLNVRAEQSDGRQFWTFDSGIRCLDFADGSASVMDRYPGINIPQVLSIDAVSNSWPEAVMEPDSATAYRFCAVRYVGERRRPIRSAPTPRFVVWNQHAVNYANVVITLNAVREGDTIEVYRTIASTSPMTSDPGDEMVLVQSVIYTGGTFTIRDYAPQTGTGVSLYTNAGQEGPSRANYSVRCAVDVSDYKQRLFYGGANGSQRASVTLNRMGMTGALIPAEWLVDTTLVSIRGIGTHTSGTSVITAVGGDTLRAARVGQVVTGWAVAAGQYPDPANPADAGNDGLHGVITSIDPGASTITLDTAATLNGTTARIVLWDWVGVEFTGGTPAPKIFPAWVDISGDGLICNANNHGPQVFQLVAETTVTTGVTPSNDVYGAGAMTIAWNWALVGLNAPENRLRLLANGTSIDTPTSLTWTYEEDQDTGDNIDFANVPEFAIVSSKPLAYSTELALTFADTPAGPALSQIDGGVADLWWSKQNQPEAVPLGNRATLGDAGQPIVRIVATTDRLWVFKTDGLWMIQGEGDTEDALIVQVADPTLRMFPECPQWACRLRDTVYVWANGGIVAVSAGGIERIDGPIRTLVQQYTPDFTQFGDEGAILWPFSGQSIKDSMIVMGRNGTDESFPSIALCYQVDTGTWSTITALKLSVDPVFGQRYLMPDATYGAGDSESGEFMACMGGLGGYFQYFASPKSWDSTFSEALPPVTGDEFLPLSVMTIDSVDGRTVESVISSGSFEVGDRFLDNNGESFYVVADDSLTPGFFTVDREGCVAGDILRFIKAVNRQWTFAANQPPGSEYLFNSITLDFEQIRSGISFGVEFRARGKSATMSKTYTYDPITSAGYPNTMDVDKEYDQTILVPAALPSRARALEVTISNTWADCYFAQDALVVQYDSVSPIIEGRRK